MAVDFKLIGSRIQDMRKGRLLTQETLAERLDFSVGYVSNMERGTTKISLDTLSKIADSLDCDVSELIQGCSYGRNTYLTGEILELIARLSSDEKRVMFKVLESYLSEKVK
ncbi:MAG: helix-turn-helix domain-containing protein [Oscillospiraceae bacterium]|nr:helix-turn-helix domain-containing protein [Oscillospiraceae bacterium]